MLRSARAQDWLVKPGAVRYGWGRKRRGEKKTACQKPPCKEQPLNLSGIKFEEGLRIILNTPPLHTRAKQKQ